MVELDAKKFGVQQVAFDRTYSLGRLTDLMLIYPIALFDAIGIALFAAVVLSQKTRKNVPSHGKASSDR